MLAPTILLSIVVAPSARARDGVDPTGGGVDTRPLVESPADAQRSADKMAALQSALNGRAIARSGASLELWSTWMAMLDRAGGAERSTGRRDPTPNPPADRTLAIAHAAQNKSYYCGPASGLMILRFWNAGDAADSGAPLWQSKVADSDHMQTDDNGSTPWSNGRWRIGMNRWLYGTNSGYYVNLADPTVWEFKHALLGDVGSAGIGFGVSTLELQYGDHYNQHPASETIGHWIVAQGYANDGDTSRFDDPAGDSSALSSAWDSVHPDFSHGTSGFVTAFVQAHGIVW